MPSWYASAAETSTTACPQKTILRPRAPTPATQHRRRYYRFRAACLELTFDSQVTICVEHC